MSIDKQSSGMPEVDPHRRTTKVNFGTIFGILLFLLLAGAMIFFIAQRYG